MSIRIRYNTAPIRTIRTSAQYEGKLRGQDSPRRTGAKKQPSYRLVVTAARAPRDGRFVRSWARTPLTDPSTVVVDGEKVAKWLGQGAQVTARTAVLLKQAGVSLERVKPAAQPAA